MLLVRFALPTSDTVVAENIDDLVTDLNLCTIADEFGRSSPFADDILESVDELFIGLHSVDVGKHRLCSDENLGACISTIYCGCIRINRVGRYRFITSMDIESWKWRFIILL